jgi:hypothetical protein
MLLGLLVAVSLLHVAQAFVAPASRVTKRAGSRYVCVYVME